MGTYRGVFWHA